MALPSHTSLSVRLFTLKGIAWEGKAQAVAATNPLGPFSLLPGHARFVSTIEGEVTVYPVGEKTPQTMAVENGLLYCRNDQIEIFLKLPFGSDDHRP